MSRIMRAGRRRPESLGPEPAAQLAPGPEPVVRQAPINPEDLVNVGLRVAAGYAWRLIVVAIAVYAAFVAVGRVQLVAVALFVGLVFSALLRPLTDLLSRALPRGSRSRRHC